MEYFPMGVFAPMDVASMLPNGYALPISEVWSRLAAISSILCLMGAFYVVFDTLFLRRVSAVGKFWARQIWLIDSHQWLSYARAKLRYVRHCRTIVEEGYETYSKQGKAFALPIFSNPPYLILPPDQLQTLINKPDTEIDEEIIHQEQTTRSYTLQKALTHDKFHFEVVKRELTRKLSLLTEAVWDELQHSLRHFWSDSVEEWSKVKLYPSCMRIVARAANRVFAGPELCRNDDFIEHSRLYSQGVFGGAATLNLFPLWMRPIVGPIITYPNRANRNACYKHAKPVIASRLRNTQKKLADPQFEWTPPADALQWLVDRVLIRGDPDEMRTTRICDRLLELNMVAIHTTSMVIANVIMDLFSAPNKEQLLESLTEECERVLAANGGIWTKSAVNDLKRIDSTIRETMRFSGLGMLGMQRMVVAENGTDFGPNIHVPQGVRVALPTHSMHHDPAFYAKPETYDPFRFSRAREAQNAQSLQEHLDNVGSGLMDVPATKNCGLITTSSDFLSFGHGRHSCPGRFFAAQELKLMLAEIIMGFEIQLLGEARPKNQELGGASVPSSSVEILVRRK